MATEDKKVVLLVPEGKRAAWEEIIKRFIDQGVLRDSVRIVQLETKENNPGNDGMLVVQSIAKTLPNVAEFQEDGVFTHKFTAVVGPGKKGMAITYALLCLLYIQCSKFRRTNEKKLFFKGMANPFISRLDRLYLETFRKLS